MSFPARLLAAAALGLPVVSHAAPDDYIVVPAVEYGEREIDLKYGTEEFKDPHARESAGSLGLGYGVNHWWFTEAYLKYHKEPGEKTKYDAWEWENKFQLTETNKYPVDVGLLVELEFPKEHDEGYELKFGPLFQADTGPVRWNANLFLERHFHTHGDVPQVTEMLYQLQARYDVSREFGVGFQAFGELGPWDHWLPASEQEHRIGPAIFGRVKLEGRQQIKYNAAWLFKASDAAPNNSFRLQVEYEF